MDAPPYELDATAPPFLFLRFRDSPGREVWAEALAATEAGLLRTPAPVILAVDLQHLRIMSSRVRTDLADWLVRADPVLRTRAAGLVFVFLTPSVRAGLSALFWLRAPSFPVAVVGTVNEAVAWGERRWEDRAQFG